MKIVITSKNPVKKKAALLGFQSIFPDQEITIEEASVRSGVSDQPMSEDETFLGAKNRAQNARKLITDADYYIGIEGGLEEKNKDMECFAWVYIESQNMKSGKGRSGTFMLPKKIVDLIHKGIELGTADDMVFNKVNSKHKQGTIGTLTNNVIDRTQYYVPAVIFALIPFLNPELY